MQSAPVTPMNPSPSFALTIPRLVSSALESHFAKYRKLVPALALINHLTGGGFGPVGERPLLRAIAFASYLESHALRAYAAGSEIEISAAKAILAHIGKGDLRDGFAGRDVYRSCWANFSDRAQTKAGLDLLCEFDWLRAERIETGGRPAFVYHVNPGVKHG
jgi:Protein of unknown function (DUF3987)